MLERICLALWHDMPKLTIAVLGLPTDMACHLAGFFPVQSYGVLGHPAKLAAAF